MSTKANQARDAAAEEWSYKLAEEKRHKDFTCPDVAAAFLAGIEWAITHDPTVKGLVEALIRVADRPPEGKPFGPFDAENKSSIAREALEAYDKARGEK